MLEEVLLQPVHRRLARVEERLRVLGDLGVAGPVVAQVARVEAVDAGAHRDRDGTVPSAKELHEIGGGEIAGERRSVREAERRGGALRRRRVRGVEADGRPHGDELRHLARAAPHVVVHLDADLDHPLGVERGGLHAHALDRQAARRPQRVAERRDLARGYVPVVLVARLVDARADDQAVGEVARAGQGDELRDRELAEGR
jgi:hypothetical protein